MTAHGLVLSTRSVRALTTWLAVLTAFTAHAGEAVFVTRGEGGLPVFTNRPVSAGSSRVIVIPSTLYPPQPGLGRGSTLRVAAPGPVVDLLIRGAAKAHAIDEALLRAVIAVESGFDPAVRSSAGAVGLMQLMPGTARRYGVADSRDPAQNIDGGTRYLKDLLAQFGGDLRLVLAAYNAGEGAVLRHGLRVPPFAETQAYVPAVLARYRGYLPRSRQAAGDAAD